MHIESEKSEQLGRTSLLVSVPGLAQQFVEAYKGCGFLSRAAEFCGIWPRTVQYWMRRGEDLIEDLASGERTQEDLTPNDAACINFHRAVSRARGELFLHHASQVQLAGKSDWRASDRFMTKAFAQDWGDRAAMELSGPGGGPIEHEHSLAAGAREALLGRLARLADRVPALEGPRVPESGNGHPDGSGSV